MSNGLGDSRWASQGSSGNSFRRGGTWECHACGSSIPLSQRICPQCNPPPNGASLNGIHIRSNVFPTGQRGPASTPQTLIPSNDAANQYRSWFSNEQTTRSTSLPPASHSQAVEGLAMSRWAPRKGSHREVWTKTKSAKPSTNAQKPHETTLDLPYQVQHYILGMIQRILEEGCYDFAARWIPQTLNGKGWDCPEAVELSTWKTFMPTSMPSSSLSRLPHYTLEAALGDAVRLRNSAVHRHLCDTEDIRKMALQSRDMMIMFSDITRQDKFQMLWVELGNWEMNGRSDPDAARARLEGALNKISERPMDDMDWTPNAVSLQEISDEKEEEVLDAMELD